MKILVLSLLVLVLLSGFFSGCALAHAPANIPSPVPATFTPAPSATPNPSPTDTMVTLVYADPFDGILARLEASDPQSPRYDPNSEAYAAFPQVVKQLAEKNASNNNGADMLAYALSFPRPDSYLAAQALITRGPEVVASDLGLLSDSLLDPRARVRLYAMLALGTVGRQGTCALGHIGPLLRDPDAYVRSAAAAAISNITGKALLPAGSVFTPQPLSESPVPADSPAGTISGVAQKWWDEQGSKINWHPGYDLCSP